MSHSIKHFAICSVLMSCSTSLADVVFSTTTPTRAVQITDLFVPSTGKTYDVHFPDGSFVELFGEPAALTTTPEFWGDEAGAISARAAMMAQLNSATPIPTGLEDPANPGQLDFFAIPHSAADPGVNVRISYNPAGTWIPLDTFAFTRVKTSNSVNENYALFTVVPEPSSLAFMGIAILVSVIGVWF